MKYCKKAAAFGMCLLIAASAAVPAMAAYADNEESAVSETEEAPGGDTEEQKVLGDFTYTVDEDGGAHIVSCSSSEIELVVPDTLDGIPVTEIEAEAFLEMHFKKIVIPASVTYISAENPFASLLQLEEIAVEEGSESYAVKDGVLYSKDMKTIICYPAAKAGTTFNIPDGVEELGIAAISSTSLTEINLPASVKTLQRHCFSFNEKLTSVDMSKTSIEAIPIMSFAVCNALTDVKFSESTLSIELAAFINCKSLTDVTLPPKLTFVGQNAFQDTAMRRIKIPDTVTTIGYCAFGYDENEVPDDTFIIVGEKNSAAQRYAKDTDTEYNYQNNFTFVDSETFAKQEAYEALDTKPFGDYEYTVIDGEACITKCVAIDDTVEVLSEIDGYTVTSVFSWAFQSCGAANIILPDTLKTIGEEAFSDTVRTITIPGGCTEIKGDEPFLMCTSLQSITVTEGDGAYSSADGVLYNKDKTILLAYPVAKEDTSFTVPASVKEIALSGVCYNDFIEEADLANVETIGNYAFEGCTKLKNVKLPKNLKVVGENAFLGCIAMESIRVYGGVETIGDYAFGYTYDADLAADIQNNPQNYAMSGESVIMPYSVMEGFKMYVEEDSLAHKYADACGIEAVLDTVEFGGSNVDKTFLYVLIGAAAAVVLAAVALITGKTVSKKKKAKAAAERKAKAAEKKKAEKEEASNED